VTHFLGVITVWCDGRLSKDTLVSPCDKNIKKGGEGKRMRLRKKQEDGWLLEQAC